MGAEMGPYRLEELLGRGGMGEVYRARDGRRARWVALKLLHPRFGADPGYRERFRREAEAAADLRDPHVVPVHDFGEIDGQLFLDMRLIGGTDLASRLREGPLDPARAVDLITQVAAALDAAHDAGLVHRDVKPSNVLVEPGGFAYLTDFGLARSAGSVSVAEDGAVIGTLAYMAPERLRAEPADARSDVYSLACLLHECLTGRPPFDVEDASAIVAAHLHDPPPTLTGGPTLSALGRVIAHGLAKQPRARPPSAGAFAAEATRALRPRVTARLTRRAVVPLPAARGLRRWVTRPSVRRTLAVATAALVLVAGAFAVLRYVGDGISVGISPVAVAFTADGSDAFIANAGSETVTVFDTRRRTDVDQVRLGGRTVGAAPDPGGEQLFVTTTRLQRHALVVIDMATARVVASVALPGPPMAAPVVDARRTTAFVPTPDGIEVVDLRTGRYRGTLARNATGLAASPDGTRLLVVDGRRPSADVIDVATGTTRASIALDSPARRVVAAPGGDTVYLGGDDPAHALTAVDVERGTAGVSTALPAAVSALTVSPDGRRLFVALAADRPVLAAVDTRTREVRVGWFMERFADDVALAVSPDGTQVYIVNTDLGTLTIDDVTRPP